MGVELLRSQAEGRCNNVAVPLEFDWVKRGGRQCQRKNTRFQHGPEHGILRGRTLDRFLLKRCT